MSDLTDFEVADLAESLVLAASEPLAPLASGYWAPTEAQTREAICAVLRVFQAEARSRGVSMDLTPLIEKLGGARP